MAKNIVISNKIYIPYDEKLLLKLKEELTYTFEGKTLNAPPETISTVSKIGTRAILIPTGRIDLMPKDYPIIDKRITTKAVIPEPSFTLRPNQEKFLECVTDNTPTYILNAKPGFGKSYCAIALAHKLQMKTLIVVHTVPLREQWEKDIKKVLGIKPGIIGSGQFDTSSSIVIANIQTLAKRIETYKEMFGLLVVDECHHTSATTFTRVVATSKAKFKIGLTGTLERKDKKQILTLDYFGPKNLYKPEQENIIKPKICLVNTDFKIPGNKMTPWAIRINKLTQNNEYKSYIINLVNALIARNRKILIVSDRVEFLEVCSEMANTVYNKSVCVTGKVGTEERNKLENLIKIGEKNALWGSTNIYKEGISINELDTLVLSNPINNEPLLEQIVGRIMRKCTGKETPEVWDIIFSCYTGQNQFNTRLAFYMREKYKLIEL